MQKHEKVVILSAVFQIFWSLMIALSSFVKLFGALKLNVLI